MKHKYFYGIFVMLVLLVMSSCDNPTFYNYRLKKLEKYNVISCPDTMTDDNHFALYIKDGLAYYTTLEYGFDPVVFFNPNHTDGNELVTLDVFIDQYGVLKFQEKQVRVKLSDNYDFSTLFFGCRYMLLTDYGCRGTRTYYLSPKERHVLYDLGVHGICADTVTAAGCLYFDIENPRINKMEEFGSFHPFVRFLRNKGYNVDLSFGVQVYGTQKGYMAQTDSILFNGKKFHKSALQEYGMSDQLKREIVKKVMCEYGRVWNKYGLGVGDLDDLTHPNDVKSGTLQEGVAYPIVNSFESVNYSNVSGYKYMLFIRGSFMHGAVEVYSNDEKLASMYFPRDLGVLAVYRGTDEWGRHYFSDGVLFEHREKDSNASFKLVNIDPNTVRNLNFFFPEKED